MKYQLCFICSILMLSGCTQAAIKEGNPSRMSLDMDIHVSTTSNGSTGDDIEEVTKGSTTTVYQIVNIEPAGTGQYSMRVRSTAEYGGDYAIEKAIEETGCERSRIYDGDCAPSLNNNFYLSTAFGDEQVLTISQDTNIFLYEGDHLRATSQEAFVNLFTQTDAFGGGDYWQPFILEIHKTDVLNITAVYLP
ncbi:hypothetical protein GW765_00885 [Candidatus Parcubacteria bacterium]|nr:hypothetical protein [Candidatus Parcubacteria bacterium]